VQTRDVFLLNVLLAERGQNLGKPVDSVQHKEKSTDSVNRLGMAKQMSRACGFVLSCVLALVTMVCCAVSCDIVRTQCGLYAAVDSSKEDGRNDLHASNDLQSHRLVLIRFAPNLLYKLYPSALSFDFEYTAPHAT